MHASFLKTKIPVTILTGFLGSGKTTMLRHILETVEDKQIALLINEFGDLGIDGGLLAGCGLKNCRDEDVIELSNGCICCTVADDFIPAMTSLLSREKQPDHIIIETSGLALPQPLIDAFQWPEIKSRVTIDGVITVIDALAVLEGRFAHEPAKVEWQRRQDEALDHETSLEDLFEDQIEAADLIILNKVDLLNEESLTFVQETVEHYNIHQVPTLLATYGKLDTGLLLGLGLDSQDTHAQRQFHPLAHHHDDNHSHDDFISMRLEPGPIEHVNQFVKRLQFAIQNHKILRLKGFVHVREKQMRLVIQAVGPRLNYYFDRPWNQGEERKSCLVVIGGKTLDMQEVTHYMMSDYTTPDSDEKVV